MSDQNPYQPPSSGPYQPPPGQQQPPGQQPSGYDSTSYPPPAAGYPPYGGPPGGYAPDPNAPYGYDRMGRPFSHKSKIVAGVLQILLGGVGAGRWYTGHTGMAVAQLLTCGGLGIWALIDGIIFLVSEDRTDSRGLVLKG
ncbi:TM2 domain-containing protein [Streptomyces johnsoniae]|uniref:TM2 domain-containing protein n=1 Tax=Streptomyces johnsoniae TaxID=3075532 RepID=A0ABU2S217_9ACTN|nr:TM2 domain-containing protein [Streptomyces sp. DSM 41886]MDT0441839.1 TM2 domain-containing protein [Streptomyces sp. DSM 41886]